MSKAMMLCTCQQLYKDLKVDEGILHVCKICNKEFILTPELAATKPDFLLERDSSKEQED
jgi:hypothetical protein